jgi:hypothetical protein
MATALQEKTIRRLPQQTPIDTGRHILRELIGFNLIHLGQRIARVETSKKLGEAA